MKATLEGLAFFGFLLLAISAEAIADRLEPFIPWRAILHAMVSILDALG